MELGAAAADGGGAWREAGLRDEAAALMEDGTGGAAPSPSHKVVCTCTPPFPGLWTEISGG
jgi:hypothetical protein